MSTTDARVEWTGGKGKRGRKKKGERGDAIARVNHLLLEKTPRPLHWSRRRGRGEEKKKGKEEGRKKK